MKWNYAYLLLVLFHSCALSAMEKVKKEVPSLYTLTLSATTKIVAKQLSFEKYLFEDEHQSGLKVLEQKIHDYIQRYESGSPILDLTSSVELKHSSKSYDSRFATAKLITMKSRTTRAMHFYQTDTGEQAYKLSNCPSKLSCNAQSTHCAYESFSPKRLIKKIYLYNLTDLKKLCSITLKLNKRMVTSFQWSKNDRYLLVRTMPINRPISKKACFKLYLFDTEDEQHCLRLMVKKTLCRGQFTADSKQLIIHTAPDFNSDGTITWYDLETCSITNEITYPECPIFLDRDAKRFGFTAAYKKQYAVIVHDLINNVSFKIPDRCPMRVDQQLSHDGNLLAVSLTAKEQDTHLIQVYKLCDNGPTLCYETTIHDNDHVYFSIKWSPHDTFLAFQTKNYIHILDGKSGFCITRLSTKNYTAIRWKANDTQLIALYNTTKNEQDPSEQNESVHFFELKNISEILS